MFLNNDLEWFFSVLLFFFFFFPFFVFVAENFVHKCLPQMNVNVWRHLDYYKNSL